MKDCGVVPDRHIPALDGLRGFAVLYVIGFHYFAFMPVLSFGWSGIDLFFVLSGYLITGRLLTTVNRPGYFYNFYRNRILRIFPLYFGALAAFFICILIFGTESTRVRWAFYEIHWKSFLLFTENWSFIFYGLPAVPYLLHFWTLAVEEQFYFIWPFVIFFTRHLRYPSMILAVLAASVVVIRCGYFHYHPNPDKTVFFYFNTLFRADSLIIGAILFRIHYEKIEISLRAINLFLVALLAVLSTALFILKSADAFQPFFATIGYTLVAILYACLIHRSVCYPDAPFSKLFQNAILKLVGRVSYGLYVFHYPLLIIFQPRLYNWLVRHHVSRPYPTAISSFACIFTTFLLAYISFRYFESPFLRMKKAGTLLPDKSRKMPS
jgi:peptidoglycan/LPS O-acetylase OafA/YrhL